MEWRIKIKYNGSSVKPDKGVRRWTTYIESIYISVQNYTFMNSFQKVWIIVLRKILEKSPRNEYTSI